MVPELALQGTVIDLLRSDVSLMSLVRSVSDRKLPASDGSAVDDYPYVHMSSIFDGWDTQTVNGFSVLTRVHVWSRSGSYAEPKRIQGRVYELLHRQPIDIENFSVVQNRRLTSRLDDDPDGKTTHGVCEYRTLLEIA